LLRFALFRIVLVLLPLVLWFAWAEVARRRGKPMGATPWAWLIAAGLALMIASLAATAVFTPRAQDAAYVPVEVGADGRVIPGGR